jgi:hypothetical protein
MQAHAPRTPTAKRDEVNYIGRVLRQVQILNDATQPAKEQHRGPIPTRGYGQTEGDEVGLGGGTATGGLGGMWRFSSSRWVAEMEDEGNMARYGPL